MMELEVELLGGRRRKRALFWNKDGKKGKVKSGRGSKRVVKLNK
jgi:hypothetical protein